MALSSGAWFTVFIYATSVPTALGPLFFASFGGSDGRLAALATAGVSFVARPLGAILFGHIGDRFGRRPALIGVLVIAAASTMGIGALPVAASIGVAAPMLLVALQLVHGLAVGGQWSGMVLMLTEQEGGGRRGLVGGFVQTGVALGSIFASLSVYVVTAVVGKAEFLAWGWRLPFFFGGVLFIAALILLLRGRTRPEPLGGAELGRPGSSVTEVLRRHPGRLILTAGLLFACNAAFYVTSSGTVDYAVNVLHLTRLSLVGASLLGALVGVVVVLLAGWLSDRIGRRPVMVAGAIAVILWAFPFFWLVNTAALELVTFALVMSSVCSSLGYGAIAAYLAELFDARVRFAGTAIAYQVGAAIAGGTAQLAVLELPSRFTGSSPLSWFLIGTGVVTLLCTIFLPETKRRQVPMPGPRQTT